MQRKSICDRISLSLILGAALMLSELGISSMANVFAQSEQGSTYISANSTEAIFQSAEKLFDQGRFQDSLQQYQQAFKIAQQQGDRLSEIIALTGVGAAQIGLRQERAALSTLLEATRILQSLPKDLSTPERQLYRKAEGETQYQFGRAYLNLEQYDNALKMLENSLAIRKEVGDRDREGKTVATIGVIYVKKFEFPKSAGYFEEGLAISRETGNRPTEAQSLFYLATFYGLLGQKDQALKMVRQSIEAYQEIGNLIGQSGSLNLEANIYSLGLEYNKAIQPNLKALDLIRQAGDRNREAEQLNAIATTYRNLNDYPKAVDFLLQAEKIYQEVGDRSGEGRNLKNIAEVRLIQGDNRAALALYAKAKQIYQELTNVPNPKSSDRQTLASILVDEGNLYTLLSQYPKAISTLQEARLLYRSVNDRQGEGVAAMYLAGVYLQLGETAKVGEILQQLPELAKNSPQLQQMGKMLIAMFNSNPSAANSQTQLTSALSLLEFFKQSGSRTSEAGMLSQIGALYFDLKQTDKAIAAHQQALEIWRAIGDPSGVANAFYNLGLVYALSNQSDKAFPSFQSALKIFREVGNRNQESKLLGNLGLLVQKQYPELAIAFYKRSVNVTESIRKELRVLEKEQQRSYQQTVAQNYRVLADLLLQKGRVMEALQVLDLLKVQELQDYLNNVQGNERTAQGIYMFPEEETQTTAIANQQIKTVEILSNGNQKIIQQVSKIPETELNRVPEYLQKLPQGHALFYPLILGNRLELIVFIPNQPPIHRSVAVTEADINELIIDFKSGLRDPDSLDVIEPATKLYDLLIKPIAADLAKANINAILYAPDAQLRYVPIAALYDGKQWLVEKYRVNNLIAYSLSDFTPKPAKPLQILAGAFGGAPNTNKFGQAGLPATVTEVQAIAQALPSTTQLVANDFSRKATESQMRNKNIVHLATHAEFNTGKPENSFLIFGNGDKVLLNEMKDLPMANVDLIVLSACQTGVGKLGNGIEILGFGYQVQRAGAKSAIASLWQVSDDGTQALMQAFYGNLKQTDRAKSESLRQAQIATIRSSKFSHPYYWSAFILISNGL
ncbi:CHAT domain-containing protein [Pseudanabaena mucicola]|uniref:CHAT domain-containing protein n=1 Tax=Pseudanabaena mucicola FACHB-723 TaxID=2692860 RepID=A0ABR7ZZL1_9CYAN|nr:CHAT domain-containing protein [Pseudanabaena mucicola]MBD2189398.1 CHAT domain-containing protein [Pseudanabaena mucicola FACHB-723]